MEKLDALDCRIMYELDLNARIPASEIAKKLRRSKETINFRINRLLGNGFLKGFYTVLNTSGLGSFYYKFYIKFRNITPAQELEIIEYIKRQPRIAYLASMEGHYDCVFLIMARDSKDIVDFFNPFMKLYGGHIQEKESVTFLTTHRLNERFFYPGEERMDLYYPIEIGDYALDETDTKMLNVLSGEAKVPLAELAKRIGITPKAVAYRLRKLEKDGIILGYVSSPNFDRLGLQFIQINISLKDPTVARSVIEYFNSTNKCLYAMELLGKYDLAVEVHVKDSEELRFMLDGFRDKFHESYSEYDVSTINKEHVVIWGPFTSEKE